MIIYNITNVEMFWKRQPMFLVKGNWLIGLKYDER